MVAAGLTFARSRARDGVRPDRRRPAQSRPTPASEPGMAGAPMPGRGRARMRGLRRHMGLSVSPRRAEGGRAIEGRGGGMISAGGMVTASAAVEAAAMDRRRRATAAAVNRRRRLTAAATVAAAVEGQGRRRSDEATSRSQDEADESTRHGCLRLDGIALGHGRRFTGPGLGRSGGPSGTPHGRARPDRRRSSRRRSIGRNAGRPGSGCGSPWRVRPSGRTPVDLMTHSLPSRLQRPVPWPPSESNTHDLICRIEASQPIRSFTVMTDLPWTRTVKSRSRKLPSSVQRQVVCTTESGLSSVQSPTSQASSSSR